MYVAILPPPQNKVDEVSRLHGPMLAQHVVVLINMKDEGWGFDNIVLDRGDPWLHHLVVLIDDKVNRSLSPFQDFVKAANRLFKQGKVIKVDVQNESHAAPSLGGLSERGIDQAVCEGLRNVGVDLVGA